VPQTQFKTAEGAGFESPAGTWFKTVGGLSHGLKQKPGEGEVAKGRAVTAVTTV